MHDIDQARQAIEEMFDHAGCTDGNIGTLEPMMDGFMCTVEFSDIGDLTDPASDVRVAEGETREFRRWHTVNGRTTAEGWHFAFQGEWGTYGPFSEAEDVLRLQVWAGRCEVPTDVVYAFDLNHDRIIALSAVSRLHTAAEALRHLPDEIIEEVSVPGVLATIVEQTDRLARAR